MTNVSIVKEIRAPSVMLNGSSTSMVPVLKTVEMETLLMTTRVPVLSVMIPVPFVMVLTPWTAQLVSTASILLQTWMAASSANLSAASARVQRLPNVKLARMASSLTQLQLAMKHVQIGNLEMVTTDCVKIVQPHVLLVILLKCVQNVMTIIN